MISVMLMCTNSFAQVSHQIVEITTLQQAKPYFSQATSNTLILFDVDSTLTTPSDPYLRRPAIKKNKAFYERIMRPLTENQKRIFSHVLVIQSPSQLLDKDWPVFIKRLQGKSKTLAMTAAKTGPLGSLLDSFPEWRYQELKRLGIDFSKTFPGSLQFKHLSDFGNEHPGIEKGIIYCGQQTPKGHVLKSVLEELAFMPENIIFIDDKMHNIHSLSSAIKHHFPEMRFIGIQYKAMEILADPVVDTAIFEKKIHDIVKITKRISH